MGCKGIDIAFNQGREHFGKLEEVREGHDISSDGNRTMFLSKARECFAC